MEGSNQYLPETVFMELLCQASMGSVESLMNETHMLATRNSEHAYVSVRKFELKVYFHKSKINIFSLGSMVIT
jgi:hypothetical protein